MKTLNLEKQNLVHSRDDLTNEVEKHLAELESLTTELKFAKVIFILVLPYFYSLFY